MIRWGFATDHEAWILAAIALLAIGISWPLADFLRLASHIPFFATAARRKLITWSACTMIVYVLSFWMATLLLFSNAQPMSHWGLFCRVYQPVARVCPRVLLDRYFSVRRWAN